MRAKELGPLLAAGVVAVIAARCQSSGSGGDKPTTLARCEVDLSAYVKTAGSGAKAKYAANNDLLAGEAASGRAGDVLLANDRIQVLIEQPGRMIGPQPYGGNIIDADIVRPGEPARDRFGEIGAFFQLGRTVRAETVEILQDGSNGGAAVVAATGPDDILDFIHVQGLTKQYGIDLPMPDADKPMNLRITNYYVLNPGETSVRMVQAFCNDGAKPVSFPVGDLVDSGGQVEIYAGTSGFTKPGEGGIAGGILSAFTGDVSERFGAWIGPDVAYGYIPESDQNQMVTIAGVTVTVAGGKSILDWTDPNNEPLGAMNIPAGKSGVLVRDFAVARDAAGLFDRYYELRGTETGTVSGVVRDSKGTPRGGVRVVATVGDKVATLFTTDASGRFTGKLPAGSYSVQADDSVTRAPAQTVVLANGETKEFTFALSAQGSISVKVRDDQGNAMPGKVTVVCQGECPTARTDATASLFRDVAFDSLPKVAEGGVFDIHYLGPDGTVTIPLAGATYNVYVSRGPEWSLFKQEVTIDADAAVNVEASLKHVVDTTGWVSSDFHVHAINSPDSPVENTERLRTFMAEGVDVMVATDHDFITDFTPWLAQIPNGSKHIKAVTGVELTTFTYGHYNSFPLVADPAKRNGGAVDWATGTGQTMTPGDIFTALQAYPEEQVIQLNHPMSGMFSALGLDTRTLWTRNSGTDYRIRPVEADAQTGDTRLWDAGFTAMEVANGTSVDGLNRMMNNWMSLLSRGVKKTGTAVSDTHKRHGDSGYPRSYVAAGTDNPEALDVAAFATAVNQGKVFGTSGPFLKVTAQTAGGTPVEIGGTLVSNGQPVTVNVEVRMPDWMDVNQVQIFANSTGTETDDKGGVPKTLPTPAATPAVTSTTENGLTVGTASAQLTLDKDASIIVMVNGTKDLFPVVGKGGDKPFAFSNPIYVDLDGQGWTPPVDLAAERARVGSIKKQGQALKRQPTIDEVRHILGRECHDD